MGKTENSTYITNWTWSTTAGAYLEPSPLLTSVHVTGKYSAHDQRRKVNTIPATKSLIYSGDLPVSYIDWRNSGTEVLGWFN